MPEKEPRAAHAEPDEFRLLRGISRMGVSGLDVEELSRRFLEHLRTHVPFDRGVVRTVEGRTGDLEGGAAVGLGENLPLPAERSDAATQAIALGRIVTECDNDPEEPSGDGPLARLGLASSLTMPLLTDEAVVGLITLRRIDAAGFSGEEIDTVSLAADQVGPSLDNARLLDTVSNLAAIVETSPDLVCRTDTDGAVQYINPAGRKMLELADSVDAHDLRLQDFVEGSNRDLLVSRAISTAVSSGSWTDELVIVSDKGRRIPVEAVMAANYHRNGTLLGVSVSMRDIELRKQAEEELQRLATTDTLTGLPNRRQLGILLDQANRSAVRSKGQHALVYLDLDGLKLVNDTHGHTIGDELIAAVGARLRESVRLSDVVARVGGDEFNLILYDAPPTEAMRKTADLLKSVSEVSITAGGERIQVTCSAGVAPFPMEGATLEDITAYADVALYQAKDAGRNQARLYDPAQRGREMVTALQQTRTAIVTALEQDRVIIHRQPIFRVGDRSVAMYEALVRIRTDEGRLLTPSDFIAEAESLDLIRQIDERVVNLVFHRAVKLAGRGEAATLTVNVSSRSVGAELAEFIVRTARETGVEPGSFVFEITETATLRSGGHAAIFVTQLADAGFKLAIDDFGSGTTSLRQIRSLDFDYLKLDGSLVRNLRTDEHDREFIRALTAMAHALGVETIAEFVQDEATMRFLAEVGIAYAQGYYLARPGPFPE